MTSEQQTMALGVVLERRPIDHRWAKWSWRAVAVIPGAPPLAAPRALKRDGKTELFHAATLELALHRKDTEGYRVNLSQPRPAIYVGLRPDADGDGVHPFVVTACPYEGEIYDLDADERVEAVPMPAAVAAVVGGFVRRHHVDVPFVKRKRKPHDPRKAGAERPRHG